MGALTSRQNAAVEEADISTNHAYKYPPRSGNYFGCHFIMGGERFDTPQPEAYLFGENADLNFLGSRPAPFPYPPPQANELTKTLKSLVNIRKESVRFVKAPDSATKIHGTGQGNKGNSFNIEFTFDSDAKCAITIYYFCTEEISTTGIAYNPRDSSLTSETFHYEKGVNQLFCQNSHIFNPNLFPEEDLAYNTEKDIFPIAIHCVVEEGIEKARQSHTTICVIDRHSDGTFALRALKQKIFIDGLCYLLQEIYGIENKTMNRTLNEDETEDSGSECVICMCDTRDTLILPCRHLCLCNSCADSLRYQANNCPICRAPFRALLQIRAVQKATSNTIHGLIPLSPQDGNNDNIPEGYVAVSLIEALNGPISAARPAAPTETEGNNDVADAVQVAEIVSRNNDKNGKQSPKEIHKTGKEKMSQNMPEFRMSVLLSKEEGGVTKELLNKHSPVMARQHSNREKSPRDKFSARPTSITQRDCVKIINEKNLVNSIANTDSQDNDEDSENEKLSPLLNSKMTMSPTKEMINNKALHIDGVTDSIDDTDTDLDEQETALNSNAKTEPPGDLKFNLNLIKESDNIVILAGAEDSDYYTPEDPHTTILTQLFNEETNSDKKTEQKSHISPPLAAIKENTTSLPDSPISGNSASTRSSGDSYSSSSSTRQLLATIVNDSASNADTNDKQKIINNCIDNIVNV